MRAGLRSRRALGHYKPLELAAVLAVVAGTALVFANAALLAVTDVAVPGWARWSAAASAGLTTLLILYAHFIEPDRLTTRELSIAHPKAGEEPLRLLHVSDLHIKRWGLLEDAVLARAQSLKPDLILITGDYTSVHGSVEDARKLVAGLNGIAPVLACRGNGDYRPPDINLIFEGTGARLLMDETAEVTPRGIRLQVAGIEPGNEEFLRKGVPARPDCFSIFLYHYPDLVPELETVPCDLMLCGHTHGGQVRLPLVGAVASFCRAGRGYTRGLFKREGRVAHISQGIGCETYGLLRLRFLCPPELALITLSRRCAEPG